METYREIIAQLKSVPSVENRWWPNYFFHFTDVNNAVNILDTGWIYGRDTAQSKGLMKNDNASARIMDFTDADTKRSARLYFRPRTPTQYHNEGYKPKHIRDKSLDASCPVPVFFLLDAVTVLSIENVGFVERGLAHHTKPSIGYTVEEFATLNFEKIYHDGPFPQGSDIAQYRHSEIVHPEGFPIRQTIRAIYCRSAAERETLIYLLKQKSAELYERYKNLIIYNPAQNLFNRNGIFVNQVKVNENQLEFIFNESAKRLNPHKANTNKQDFVCKIRLLWLSERGEVLSREVRSRMVSYVDTEGGRILFEKQSDWLKVSIHFDDALMYENVLTLQDEMLW